MSSLAKASTLELPAPAKLNLFLHILGRRPDGYHELETLFQFLDYGDEVGLTALDTDRIELDSSVPVRPEDNLAWRAAQLLKAETGCTRGCHIALHKRLPLGGGLGGGSSDAATVLLGLNALWGLGLPLADLAVLGVRLGADVPVFVGGQSAFAEGIGERLTPVMPEAPWYLVVVPPVAVSTAEVFANPELTRDTPALRIRAFPSGGGHNDFEPLVRRLYPEVDAAWRWLNAFAPARLTGSGAALFAAFSTAAQAKAALSELPAGCVGFCARGCNRSPLHETLARIV